MPQASSFLSARPDERPAQMTKARGPEMALIPAGTAILGTSDNQIRLLLEREDWAREWVELELFQVEQPQHSVSLPAFEIGKFPVTNEAYDQFVYATSYRIPRGWMGLHYLDGQADHPVSWVSWEDCQAYIRWLNQETGSRYRLATEAEWERAAQGGDTRIYPWGDVFDPWRCNTAESGKHITTEAGSYSPGGDSRFGVVDMVGNVWEWTSTLLRGYPYQAGDGREDLAAAGKRVVRGGAWYYSRKLARCSAREGMLPNYVSSSLGFRLARSV